MNHPVMFPKRDNKAKLVPTSFSFFLELYERKINFSNSYKRKINFSKKCVIVITVLISLHYKETKLFYLFCSYKKVVEKSN